MRLIFMMSYYSIRIHSLEWAFLCDLKKINVHLRDF
ncbi:hypothetical protein FHU10_4935 [Serratia fonticola]|uniref:Uncharacterized protein n=1 Tax=Serratia fonticola TaxID=47917 RepID=A0A542D3V7_SERFO|nr:hypothetical protein FHU09_2768 [Serratia fonticola]TQI97768.1 hypothetical protein FHU11_3275 [Serratia fonticola]TVZ72266.1 hypothetical protein FHU10_4935 [Serratia fonticola]